MLVMRTAEDLANPLGELISAEQTKGLYHFALAMNPFGLYRVKPWAPLGQKAAYNPNSFAAVFDLAIMFSEPASDLLGDVAACVVPDQKQDLLATSFERLALCQRTPRRRTRVARMVSPETCFSTRPSSKATCAAICSVQRLVFLPNSLGERWSNSLTASALSSSKAARVLLGRDERGMRALRPRSLKSWMASRTVCCPQPRFSAICGTSSPLEEARSIWERRKVKASLERSPASSRSRSSVESLRTKIGGFIPTTVTHNPKSALNVH